jgi:hypothetical protein
MFESPLCTFCIFANKTLIGTVLAPTVDTGSVSNASSLGCVSNIRLGIAACIRVTLGVASLDLVERLVVYDVNTTCFSRMFVRCSVCFSALKGGRQCHHQNGMLPKNQN